MSKMKFATVIREGDLYPLKLNISLFDDLGQQINPDLRLEDGTELTYQEALELAMLLGEMALKGIAENKLTADEIPY